MAFAALAVRFGLKRDDHAGEGIADDDGEELRDRPGRDEGIGRVRRSELGGEDDIAQHAGDLDADRAKGDDGNIEQELPVIPQTAEPAGDRQRATLDSHGWNHSTRITVRLVRASGFSMPQKSHGETGIGPPGSTNRRVTNLPNKFSLDRESSPNSNVAPAPRGRPGVVGMHGWMCRRASSTGTPGT